MDDQRTVTLVVPPGYASAEEFANDCGFEIAKPPALPWNAGSNRHYGPVETMAKTIYDGFEYDGPGVKPEWTPHGNGTKQDEARSLARAELARVGHVEIVHG